MSWSSLSPPDRKFLDFVACFTNFGFNVSEAETLVWFCWIPWDLGLFGNGTRLRQSPHEGFCCVMRNVARHVVVLLMNVAVQHGYIRMGHQRVNDSSSVTRRPIPVWSEIK